MKSFLYIYIKLEIAIEFFMFQKYDLNPEDTPVYYWLLQNGQCKFSFISKVKSKQSNSNFAIVLSFKIRYM